MYSAAAYNRDIKINCCSSYFLMLSSLSILLKKKWNIDPRMIKYIVLIFYLK